MLLPNYAIAKEIIPPGEAAAMAVIAESAAERVRQAAAAAPIARRDAHPKPHGTVKAEFRVLDDIPTALRAGIFRTPRSYEALIRFSNGAAAPAPDAEPVAAAWRSSYSASRAARARPRISCRSTTPPSS
jgi:hypothetical protein